MATMKINMWSKKDDNDEHKLEISKDSNKEYNLLFYLFIRGKELNLNNLALYGQVVHYTYS